MAGKKSGHRSEADELERSIDIERDTLFEGMWYWQKLAIATAASPGELAELQRLPIAELAQARRWKLLTN